MRFAVHIAFGIVLLAVVLSYVLPAALLGHDTQPTGPEAAAAHLVPLVALRRFSIHRFHDKEANATCWISGRGGISCLPDNTIWGYAR